MVSRKRVEFLPRQAQPVQYVKQISGTATSTISQADADNKAKAEAESVGNQTFLQDGQNYANQVGVCTPPPERFVERIYVSATIPIGSTGINSQATMAISGGSSQSQSTFAMTSVELQVNKTYPDKAMKNTSDTITITGTTSSGQIQFRVEVYGDQPTEVTTQYFTLSSKGSYSLNIQALPPTSSDNFYITLS